MYALHSTECCWLVQEAPHANNQLYTVYLIAFTRQSELQTSQLLNEKHAITINWRWLSIFYGKLFDFWYFPPNSILSSILNDHAHLNRIFAKLHFKTDPSDCKTMGGHSITLMNRSGFTMWSNKNCGFNLSCRCVCFMTARTWLASFPQIMYKLWQQCMSCFSTLWCINMFVCHGRCQAWARGGDLALPLEMRN